MLRSVKDTSGVPIIGKQFGMGVREGVNEEIIFSYKINELWRSSVQQGDYIYINNSNLLYT